MNINIFIKKKREREEKEMILSKNKQHNFHPPK
jgi:hypothetical protein